MSTHRSFLYAREKELIMFNDVLEKVLTDSRTHQIPILYIVQVLIVCDDLRLFKEKDDEFST